MEFVCGNCGELFPMSEDLEKHCLTHHSGRTPFKCHKCSKSFRNWLGKRGLKAHLETHEPCQDEATSAADCSSDHMSGENFIVEADPLNIEEFNDLEFCERVCGDCGIQYSNLVTYETHCKTHDSQEPFKCIECSLKFKKRVHLEEHRASHLLVKLYSCGECGKEYSFQWSLLMHLKEHGVRPGFQCIRCGLEFFNANFLSSHERLHEASDGPSGVDLKSTHVDLQPCKFHSNQFHPCPVCSEDKNASSPPKISSPVLECESCELEFATKDDLCRHLDLHKNPQTFKCEVCDKVFGSYIGLREHVYGSHSDMEVHWCEDCGGSGFTSISISPDSGWSKMGESDDWANSAENVDIIQHTVKAECDPSSTADDSSGDHVPVTRHGTIKESFKAGSTTKQKSTKYRQRKQSSPEKTRTKKRTILKANSDVKQENEVKLERDSGPKSKKGTHQYSSRKVK